MKENKQPKPKKTSGQKRLIASMIAMYCCAGAVLAVLPGMIARNFYDKDIRELNDEQTAIYEKFMESDEFGNSFKKEFTKISNDYANGLITYEEFDEKVKHLNSVKYAQEVLENSNNTRLKAQAEVIDQKKKDRLEKYQSNPVVNGGLIGLVGFGTATMSSIIASAVYSIKDINEEKRKRTSNKIKFQDYETGPVLIDKTTTYYAYDHKETKTSNNAEEKNSEDTLNK